MPRTCSICSHPQRAEIDQALITAQASLRHISKQYGISPSALCRHKAEHLPRDLAKANGAREVAAADNLLEQLQDLKSKALDILAKAEKAGKLSVALQGIRAARELVESLCKVALVTGQQVHGGRPLELVRPVYPDGSPSPLPDGSSFSDQVNTVKAHAELVEPERIVLQRTSNKPQQETAPQRELVKQDTSKIAPEPPAARPRSRGEVVRSYLRQLEEDEDY